MDYTKIEEAVAKVIKDEENRVASAPQPASFNIRESLPKMIRSAIQAYDEQKQAENP